MLLVAMSRGHIMLKREQATTIFTILILIVVSELLPYGAVLHFGNPEGEPFRETFSYFDPTPYGYANFGPFITALLTCCLLVMSAINLFIVSGRIKKAIKIIAFLAVIASLAPLLVNCYSIIGGVISVLLLILFLVQMKKEERV